MEKEISSGTMLGIVLIALAAVIGLGFGVFSIAKGVANEGTVGVQDNLAVVSESAVEDYNDKIVTGTMVRSAVTNFNGKSVAILINTTAMDKAVIAYKEHSNLNVYTMTTANGTIEVKTQFANKAGGAAIGPKVEDGSTHYYVNYNALLGDTADATGKVTWSSSQDSAKLVLKDGMFTSTSCPFAVDQTTGKVCFDYSVGGFSRTGNCEYLNATAKFDANLIKDETGTTVGIVFTQRVQ
jgi:hypothetical protein